VKWAAALAVLVATAAISTGASSADTGIAAVCNGAPCSSGWYRSDVNLSFVLPAGSSNPSPECANQTVTEDTAGEPFRCSVVVSGTQCCVLVVTIKRDATPPTATAVTPARSADSNGWYNHAVAFATSGTDALSGVASCTSTTYSGPDSGSATVSGTCTDAAGNVSAPRTATFAYDATPPTVTPAAARGPDADGWYNHEVAVGFAGADGVSGLDSCTSGSYSGPDAASASVAGSCRDKAGNTGTASFALRYDATPPTVTTATPERPPDANGWYNHKVVVAFGGSDATSGIASCDAPAYEKPDSATASVAGRCTDNAGNSSAAGAFQFKYDSSPPKLSALEITSLDRTATLSWRASADVSELTIVRTGGGPADTVYRGRRVTTFTDRRIRNGNRYTYTITALDTAGNAVSLKGLATPAASLLSPRAAAHVTGGVTLRWRRARGASYYNVQLWTGGRKVLTTWPATPALHLLHLPRGKYTWLVWPGKGDRSRHRYGALIGSSTFVVTG
jgi:hypothetical protein